MTEDNSYKIVKWQIGDTMPKGTFFIDGMRAIVPVSQAREVWRQYALKTMDMDVCKNLHSFDKIRDYAAHQADLMMEAEKERFCDASPKKNQGLRDALTEIKLMLECQFCKDGSTTGIKGHYMRTLINIADAALKGERCDV